MANGLLYISIAADGPDSFLVSFHGKGGQGKNPNMGRAGIGFQCLRGGQSIHSRKLNIHQDEIRLNRAHQRDGVGAVGRLKDLVTRRLKEENGELQISLLSKNKQARSNWGTMRALLQNAVTGAAGDFSKELIIEGVGYRAESAPDMLTLNLGYSHPIKFPIPAGIKIAVEKNIIKVSGADKAVVGQVAAKIRKFRKPEPYKGKGIRYSTEVVRRKAGKKAGTSGK